MIERAAPISSLQKPSGQRILFQTTIRPMEDDWHVGRFALLAGVLRENGHVVTARDRGTDAGFDDPFITGLSRNDFDQVWLFAVDTGDGLTKAECAAVEDFRTSGGAVLATRDHQDLGSSLCPLSGIGAAHYFHTKHLPAQVERINDDVITTAISWPNFHSGSNGGVQHVESTRPVHPVMLRADGSTLDTLPSHPHEGGVSAAAANPVARIVATGVSEITGRHFNIAIALDSRDGAGRGWAESSFHHFADYNWDTARGCPSFVSEAPSSAIERDPSLLDDTKRYAANIADWLGD